MDQIEIEKATTRPNYYEDLIDNHMLVLVSDGDEEVYDYLEELPKSEQRSAILSILDKDISLFDKIQEAMEEDHLDKMAHGAGLVEMMRKYVGVGETEKKKFGEVMTPIWLVEDMLDQLYGDVWSNPHLKWLDPCNGCGVFPSVIVSRLMDGLAEAFPSSEERYKHIVENMLYVCELQPKNMFLYLCAFDPQDKYLLNIYTGSFLTEEFDTHMKNEWSIDKFDIIVGNPPYQSDKGAGSRRQPLWHKFVLKSLEISAEFGFLTMVHPSGWRNVAGHFKKVQEALLSRRILDLSMHDAKEGVKTFGAATPYDFYTVQNTPADGHLTIISGTDGSATQRSLDEFEFVPSGKWNEIQALLAKDGEQKVEVLYSCAYHAQRDHMSKQQGDAHQYPCTRNIGEANNITKTYWSNTKTKGHFGISKVIFGRFGYGVYVDASGEYGMTQDCAGIVDDPENLECIKQAMQSDEFKAIMAACKTDGHSAQGSYNHKVIALFRKDFWKDFLDTEEDVEPSGN